MRDGKSKGIQVDDSSLDVLGIKPLAKAAEHASIKTVDGLGAFFGAICMPAAEEIGLFFRDRVARFRQDNLEAIALRTKRKLAQHRVEPDGSCSPRLVHEVIEQASWVEDSCIQDMWAGLLSVACGKSVSDDALLYTETLRRLSPYQARVLNAVYSDPRACDVEVGAITNAHLYTPRNPLTFSAAEMLRLYPGDLSDFVNIAMTSHDRIIEDSSSHAIALGRFRPQFESLISMGLFRDVRIVTEHAAGASVVFLPTLQGLDIFMRGMGYSVYPLEAFILTQQHWLRIKARDPVSPESEYREN